MIIMQDGCGFYKKFNMLLILNSYSQLHFSFFYIKLFHDHDAYDFVEVLAFINYMNRLTSSRSKRMTLKYFTLNLLQETM